MSGVASPVTVPVEQKRGRLGFELLKDWSA